VLQAVETNAAGVAVTVDVVTSIEEFDQLRSDWGRLVDQMDVPSPFLSWEWHRVWWAHFGGRRQMRVLVLRQGGEVAGIVPLYRRSYGPFRVLVPFGWPDRLTEIITPVIPTGTRARLLPVLSAWLESQPYSVGLIAGLEEGQQRLLREQTLSERVLFDWRTLPPTWDELLKDLTRSMRGNIRYYPRMMEKQGHQISFRIASDVAAVRAGLEVLFRLHTARSRERSGERHRDRLQQRTRREFLTHLAQVLAPRGQMKVGILQLDCKDVAAQLWFERGSTMFIHYSGYEPELSRFSVAMVALSEVMRLGIARGMTQVEFLRGSKPFKTRWNTQQRVQADVYYVWRPWVLPMFYRVRSLRRRLRDLRYRRAVRLPLADQQVT
jgi:CelD/BcsL family acetyltransferase involved in cellulose biosynthesis